MAHFRPLQISSARGACAALLGLGVAMLASAAHARPPTAGEPSPGPRAQAAPGARGAAEVQPDGAPSGGALPTSDGAAEVQDEAELAAEPAAPPAAEPTADVASDQSSVASTTPFQPKPPPLHVEYLQYGVALVANARLASGATCPDNVDTPCILGGGGGLVVRVGWRPPGTWYYGGAYEFANMDSGNLYRLGILQQVRAEMRYMPETGLRTAPYVAWGLGAFGYGNEWGMETGGGVAYVGGGVEFEVTRLALVGVSLAYSPMVIVGWTDTAEQARETSLAQFLRLEVVFELRSELSREERDVKRASSAPPPR